MWVPITLLLLSLVGPAWADNIATCAQAPNCMCTQGDSNISWNTTNGTLSLTSKSDTVPESNVLVMKNGRCVIMNDPHDPGSRAGHLLLQYDLTGPLDNTDLSFRKDAPLKIVGGGDGNRGAILQLFQYNIGASNVWQAVGEIYLGSSRATTPATHAAVDDTDWLGRVYFFGDDGTDMNNIAAEIDVLVDETTESVATDVIPASLAFRTLKKGPIQFYTDNTKRVEIGPTGNVTFTNPATGDATIVLPTGAISGTEILDDTVVLGTDTTGGYAGSSTEGGAATTATALAANGGNCGAGSAPLGVDASGAVESCTDYEEDLSNSAGLAAAISDETGTGVVVFSTSPALTTPNIGSATGSVSGNAGTATALAADPANCTTGQSAGGITAAGVAEACLDPITHTEMDTLAEFDTQIGITGTPSASTYWRGDNSWATPSASNSFQTIDAPTGTDPVASSATDTLTITAAAAGGLTVTGTSSTDTLDFKMSVGTADNQIKLWNSTTSAWENRILNGDFTDDGTYVSLVSGISEFGTSVDDTELTAEDFGAFTCTGDEDGCTLQSQDAGILADGGTTNLTCSSTQGAGSVQVMDSGAIQVCSGAATSLLAKHPPASVAIGGTTGAGATVCLDIPARLAVCAASGGCTAFAVADGTNFAVGGIALSQTTDNTASFLFSVPANFNASSPVTVSVFWYVNLSECNGGSTAQICLLLDGDSFTEAADFLSGALGGTAVAATDTCGVDANSPGDLQVTTFPAFTHSMVAGQEGVLTLKRSVDGSACSALTGCGTPGDCDDLARFIQVVRMKFCYEATDVLSGEDGS